MMFWFIGFAPRLILLLSGKHFECNRCVYAANLCMKAIFTDFPFHGLYPRWTRRNAGASAMKHERTNSPWLRRGVARGAGRGLNMGAAILDGAYRILRTLVGAA